MKLFSIIEFPFRYATPIQRSIATASSVSVMGNSSSHSHFYSVIVLKGVTVTGVKGE